MAWMLSNLFLQCDDPQDAIAAAETVLADSDHRVDRDGILGEPPPVIVSPVVEGWVAVVSLRGWVDDLLWAGDAASAATGGLVLSCELIGNSLRLRLGEHRAGEQVQLVASPDDAWVEPPPGAKMPRYEDVEQRAWQTLRTLGVPRELLLIGSRPLGCEARRQLGEGALIELKEGSLARTSTEVDVAAEHPDAPPILPRETTRDFGLMLLDERYVDGKPTAASVAQLLAIEEQLLERVRGVSSGLEPQLTISYFNGPFQQQLDDLLRASGHHVTPSPRRAAPPWWQFWRHFGLGWRR